MYRVVEYKGAESTDSKKLEEEFNKFHQEGWWVVATYFAVGAGLMVVLRKTL